MLPPLRPLQRKCHFPPVSSLCNSDNVCPWSHVQWWDTSDSCPQSPGLSKKWKTEALSRSNKRLKTRTPPRETHQNRWILVHVLRLIVIKLVVVGQKHIAMRQADGHRDGHEDLENRIHFTNTKHSVNILNFQYPKLGVGGIQQSRVD